MLTALEQRLVMDAAKKLATAHVRAANMHREALKGLRKYADAERLRAQAQAEFADFLKEVGEFEQPARPRLRVVKESRHA